MNDGSEYHCQLKYPLRSSRCKPETQYSVLDVFVGDAQRRRCQSPYANRTKGMRCNRKQYQFTSGSVTFSV